MSIFRFRQRRSIRHLSLTVSFGKMMKKHEKISDCRCIGCDEKITCNAKVCPACGTFQNWRRHLNLGSAVISLLVAFLSLIIVLISQVKNLKTPDSDLTAFIINVVGPVKYGDGKDHATI